MKKITITNSSQELDNPSKTESRGQKIEIQKLRFEENLLSFRPNSWEEYIGQENIKKNLNVSIQAAKLRNEALDHTFFFGPPGLGKTALAYIIAKEMNTNLKVSAAPMITKSGELAALLSGLKEGDILFIDEIHRLSPAIEEILYPAMEDFRLDIIIGSGPAAQTIKIDLPRFTLLGATTRIGMLSNPLRDRFGMSFRMNFYSEDELQCIIEKVASKLEVQIDKLASAQIAKRSRGTPRIALNLLRRVRDYAQVNNDNNISESVSIFALNELGINDLGFDELDLKYLEVLSRANRAMGLSTIAAALSEDSATIEDVIEPYLFANGYIERTIRGRIATQKTYDLLGISNNKENSLF